ncbi:MAG: glycerol-3-phosphate 1-O-acyltransferase [Chloroflexi bacterium]|nr:glycerol-3-phosphate 1-O-acyltransferase PlsY [Chloroflexota bacterium]MQC18752.1 glycerol-3-phosphate 1-O-acyltransferase [Chloroflexota bacterium]
MNPFVAAGLAAVVGYGLGGIPFGVIVGRLAGIGDVRQYGSGKTGFTNSLRTMGVKWALLVVAGDVTKGAAAVLIGQFVLDEPAAGAVAGAAAVLGHIYPVFAGFRGGRGVATAFGAFLAVSPLVALAVLAVSLVVLAVFRYASLMSVTGVFAGFVVVGVLALLGRIDASYFVLFAAPTMLLVELSHIGNIKRLLAGTEPKLGQGGDRRAAAS